MEHIVQECLAKNYGPGRYTLLRLRLYIRNIPNVEYRHIRYNITRRRIIISSAAKVLLY